MFTRLFCLAPAISILLSSPLFAQDTPIIHDAQYYILEAQNGEQWIEDNAAVDALLAEFREGNAGNPPNIVSILIDDLGFGDMGIPELNAVRGIETPVATIEYWNSGTEAGALDFLLRFGGSSCCCALAKACS